jgi:hypothetical protein
VESLPDLVNEYTLAGLFTVGTAAALVLTVLWALLGSHAMLRRWATLTLVLTGFAALFWLEPLLEEYV